MNSVTAQAWVTALGIGMLTVVVQPVPVRGEEATRAGWVVHLDETGKPAVPEPAQAPAAAAPADGAAAEVKPLPAVQAAPGGGEMVVLDDRFNHNSVGHRNGAQVRVGCEREAPARPRAPVAGSQR